MDTIQEGYVYEREKQFSKLNRVNFINPNNPLSRQRNVSVTDIGVLERMIVEAVRDDAQDDVAKFYPETNSRVLKLKKQYIKLILTKQMILEVQFLRIKIVFTIRK